MQSNFLIQAKNSQNKVKDLLLLLKTNREQHLDLMTKYGSVVFRGFNCQSREDFSKCISACSLGHRQSQGKYTIPRTFYKNNIYSSSDLDAHLELPLHHEKPRSKEFPSHIYFFCQQPAIEGGATTFARANDIWRDLPLSITNKILKHGVMYKELFILKPNKMISILNKYLNIPLIKQLPHFNDYESSYFFNKIIKKTKNKLIVESFLPGVVTHPITGELLWFNSSAYLNYFINSYYKDFKSLSFFKKIIVKLVQLRQQLPIICDYGNGQFFNEEEIYQISTVINKHTNAFVWQQGDFMIVDNLILMHGKLPHVGERKLFSAMTK